MNKSPQISFIVVGFFFLALIVLGKLFYWQVIMAEELSLQAANQRSSLREIAPVRGNILASDGFPLAINKEGFLVYANPKELTLDPKVLADSLAPIMAPNLNNVKIATDASTQDIKDIEEELLDNYYDLLISQLSKPDLVWSLLKRKLSLEKKEKVEALNFDGIYFTPEPIRTYPESTMSAHILGFIGQDDAGKNVGYFGLEGFYDLELSGRIGIMKQEKDAVNRPIPIGKFWDQKKRDGRHLQLYLDRSIQFLVENEVKDAMENFGAKSISVIVMDPKTGGIIAMTSSPAFDPNNFAKYSPANYINPNVALTYEPGSTFKILTVAAAINEGLITPETKCDICDGPIKINSYFIRTWNNKYYPNTNMIEALAHSDNTAMVFIAKKLGLNPFLSYLNDFGIGQRTGIDLQGEAENPLREDWKEVDLYTASFGQGLVVTPIQMIQAVGAVANDGIMLKPQMVHKIIDTKQETIIQPKEVRRVLSKETADTVTDMMVAAVNYGDAKWAAPKGYSIAGKTGTAQVVTSDGYDEVKTIASFIGFAPADDPQFLMLTIVREPTSSPWGSETAAPLFFDIAKKLFMYMEIPTNGSN